MNERKWFDRVWTSPLTLVAGTIIALVGSWTVIRELYPAEQRGVSSYLHLVIPELVLVIEVYMLGWIRRESHERAHEAMQRQRVMDDLNSFRISLGRAHYMNQLEWAILHAEHSVDFTTATMASSWSSPEQRRVMEAVRTRELKRESPYIHRGLVARRPETLAGTLELLTHTKVDIKMTEVMNMSRLRFLVKDHDMCVLGVAEGEPSLAQPIETKKSFTVESAMLAGALRARFEDLWNEGESPWQYLDTLISTAKRSHQGYTRREVLRLLGANAERLRVDELERRSKEFAGLPE